MFVLIAGGGRTAAQLATLLLEQDHQVHVVEDEKDVPSEFKEAYKSIIREIGQHAREKKWPELLYYPTDEPTSHRKRMIAATMFFRR